ncbi:MAG TPA: type I methionyl aminopeptidase [Chitinophagales bacterium]|nr:type I methionyl aminopeptidase [Chitinophagales bacterium]
MIHFKSNEEIELMRISSLMVSSTHATLVPFIKPGVTLKSLDKIAEQYIKDNGGYPAFLGYNGFPGSLCISVNEEVVHGIPSDRVIKEGDLLSIDCGVKKNGFFGDSAFTFPVCVEDVSHLKLLKVTLESLTKGIEQVKVGNRIGDIGYAIQNYTEKLNGYGVVRELVGHGIGKSLHESPDVPNYGKRGSGLRLIAGMAIAIEPMINLGTHKVKQLNDGWTIVTVDGKPSAHFEHTVALTQNGVEVLSNHELIFKELKINEYISDFQ